MQARIDHLVYSGLNRSERHFQLSPTVKPFLEFQKYMTLTLANLLFGAIPALQVS